MRERDMPHPAREERAVWSEQRFKLHMRALLPQMLRVARRLVESSEEVDELVHDACVKAFADLAEAEIASESECRLWLLRNLIEAFRDHARRRKRSPLWHLTDFASSVETIPCGASGPEPLGETRRFAAAASFALSRLPGETRAATVLFYIEGLSYQEIAQILDRPVMWVMARLWRGRRNVRTQLRAFVEP